MGNLIFKKGLRTRGQKTTAAYTAPIHTGVGLLICRSAPSGLSRASRCYYNTILHQNQQKSAVFSSSINSSRPLPLRWGFWTNMRRMLRQESDARQLHESKQRPRLKPCRNRRYLHFPRLSPNIPEHTAGWTRGSFTGTSLPHTARSLHQTSRPVFSPQAEGTSPQWEPRSIYGLSFSAASQQ